MNDTIANGTRPRIVIIGAGAAGVFTAYRLKEMYDDKFDIELVERNGRVGGNTFTQQLEFGGKSYSIDCGAQFFYKNPQASYVSLLEELGLFDDPAQIVTKPTGFTIWDRAADEHLFWIPQRVGDFFKYSGEDWERIVAFGVFLAYGFFFDRHQPHDWSKSVDEWLDGLVMLDDEFKDKVLRNFFYQFVTLPPDRIGEASALYAITYLVRNVFGEPRVDEPDPDSPDPPGLETFEVYQSLIGLDGILKRVLATTDVTPRLGDGVDAVRKNAEGRLEVVTSAGTIEADHVVFATDPQIAASILSAGNWANPGLVSTLRGMEYAKLPISMQSGGSCWMPEDRDYWEAVNTVVAPNAIGFSAWFGPLRDEYDGDKKVPVFKSWSSPSLDPGACEYNWLTHEHSILMPTTTFMGHREALDAYQGQDGIWFAGGWTNWFDSQEAALDSATEIAERLPMSSKPGTGRAKMVTLDPESQRRGLEGWLDRVARAAPEDNRARIRNAVRDVESEG